MPPFQISAKRLDTTEMSIEHIGDTFASVHISLIPQSSERTLSAICAVAKRSDYHCGGDPVVSRNSSHP